MRASRPIVIALGIALVASAIFVGVATSPPPAPRPLAPTVFYEVLDAHNLSLLAVPLDGTTKARVVVSRPSTGEGQISWEVAPGGAVALAIMRTAGGGQVEAVDLVGGKSLWHREIDGLPWPGVWSSDGRQWASQVETPDGGNGRIVLVVDVAAGTVATSRVEPAWWPQGFTTDGDLVLTEEVRGELGDVEAWRFRIRQRETGAIVPVDASLAATTPRTTGSSAVATEVGRAVRRSRSGTPETGGEITRLEAIDLRTGQGTFVGPEEDTNYNWIALTPDGSRIMALIYTEEIDGESQNALLVLDGQGAGEEVWRGPGPGDEVISRDGRYLGMTTWVGHSLLTVVHLGSGNSAEIPLPPRTIAAAIRTIVDPADVALIAVAPLELQASAAPTPATAPLAGAPRFLATSSELTADGSWIGRQSILAPGQGGGIAVVEAMPPLELPPDGYVEAHPRPGTDQILVEASSLRPAHFWLWTPGQAPAELDLPADMPPNANGPHWRPDGGAIAFNYWKQIGDEIESGVAILDLTSHEVRIVPVTGPYLDLAGWAGDGRRLLLNYQVCTEGCPGRFAFLARLDPDTGVVAPFESGDRDPAAYLAFHDERQRAILLTSIQLDGADDVVLGWPAALGDQFGSPEWSSDLRDLYVTATTDDVATVYLLRDVLGRGPGTFAADPIELGRLPAGVRPGSLSTDREWVLASDRAGTSFLVKLTTGESWEIGPFVRGDLSWLPAR